MLRTRILSGLILIPIVGVLVYLGGWWFTGGIIVAAGLAAHEFYRLMGKIRLAPCQWLGLAMVIVLIVGAGHSEWLPWAEMVFTLLLLASLVWHMVQRDRPSPGGDWVATVAGAIYLGWLGGRFASLRMMPDGLAWVVLALLSTWITDSGAYFVGRRWGKRKLAPRLSPKKTWEGAIGGWVTGVALTPLLAWALGLPVLHGLIVGILVATVAPFGDLTESMFKRQAGVKDSGNLIPGHGGMLDRIDSLLFVIPVVYYYLLLVVR